MVRFADRSALSVVARISPLSTLLASVFEVRCGLARGSPPVWCQHVARRTSGPEFAPLDVYRATAPSVPDFLAPIPKGSSATIGAELQALARTRPTLVRDDIRRESGDDPPRALEPFVADPAAALARLALAMRLYWDTVFAPLWPVMHRLLEREVTSLGRALIEDGPQALLGRLSQAVELREGALRWRAAEPGAADFAGRRLILVPMVCGPDGLMTNHLTAEDVLIAYAVPGASTVWEGVDERGAFDPVSDVLGATRAAVMLGVQTMTTTTELAERLRLAPATVSHHLAALNAQGLVSNERHGRCVYYQLNARGRRLRDALTVMD